MAAGFDQTSQVLLWIIMASCQRDHKEEERVSFYRMFNRPFSPFNRFSRVKIKIIQVIILDPETKLYNFLVICRFSREKKKNII